jgi:hypothetical protein
VPVLGPQITRISRIARFVRLFDLPASRGTTAGKLASILRRLNATSSDLSNDHFAL